MPYTTFSSDLLDGTVKGWMDIVLERICASILGHSIFGSSEHLYPTC